MHDNLLKAALESGKTKSRKARSRMTSNVGSAATSAAPSPAQSRAASTSGMSTDSDEFDESDSSLWSLDTTIKARIDASLNEDDDVSTWVAHLNICIEQITDLKHSSTAGRANSLRVYTYILRMRYAKSVVEGHITELLSSMLKSIKQESTPEEAVQALKALATTILTLDSSSIYSKVARQVKRSIESSGSPEIKTNAIYTLGVVAAFGGAGDDDLLDIMAFFMEIIESDGGSIDALDQAEVVTAALEQWGLLATYIDDLQAQTNNAIEAFAEQLESTDVGVQIAAGENIALLFEKSYTPLEEGETEEKSSGDEDTDHARDVNGDTRMVKRYRAYRDQESLVYALDALANASTRRISKKKRKDLRSSFVYIRNSVENPRRGPGFSTVQDEDGSGLKGAALRMRIDRYSVVQIDKWWKQLRLHTIKRTLQAGLSAHYDENNMVSQAVPSEYSTQVKTIKSRKQEKSKRASDRSSKWAYS